MASVDRIRQFLTENLADRVEDGDDIFDLGLASSMFVIQLVAFVEKEFDVHISAEDLVLDNLCSIESIDGLVGRLSAAV